MLTCDWGVNPPDCVRTAGNTENPAVADDFIGKATKVVLMGYNFENEPQAVVFKNRSCTGQSDVIYESVDDMSTKIVNFGFLSYMIPSGWQLYFYDERQTIDTTLPIDPMDATTFWQFNDEKKAYTDPIKLQGSEKGPSKGGWVDADTQQMRCIDMPEDWDDKTKSVLLCRTGEDCSRDDVYCCL